MKVCVLLTSITWLLHVLIFILALLKLASIENQYDVECPLSNILCRCFIHFVAMFNVKFVVAFFAVHICTEA